MVDQSLVQSGLDIEVLLSARFVRYALLAQIEAGLLPTVLEIVDQVAGLDLRIDLHPPTDYDRRYVPEPVAVLPAAVDGSFDTLFVFGDADGANVQLSIVADIVDNTSNGARNDQPIGLMLAVGLTADPDDRGFESNHRLSVSFVKFDPLTVLGLALAGIDVDDVTDRVRQQLDRTVPFGVASGQAVQCAVMQLMPGGGGRPPALGVYVNLALKDGPEGNVRRRPRRRRRCRQLP